MATPRRSTRLASRASSVVSDVDSQTGRRGVDRASKSPTNAGHVGRLVSTRIASSRAYGASGSGDRGSAQPEDMEVPDVHQNFATSFAKERDRVRATASLRPLPEEENIHRPLAGIRETSVETDVSPESQATLSSAGHHSRHSDPNRLRIPMPTAADGPLPATRDAENTSSFISKSWNDLRETAFTAWAVHNPSPMAVLRHILYKIFGPIFSALILLSKLSAMFFGLLFTLTFIYLVFDLAFRTIIFHNTTPADYMRERSAQLIQSLPGSGPIIQPFPISGDQHGQIKSFYNSILQVQDKIELVEKEVDYLRRQIPDNIMLTYNSKTGRNEIPGAFWHALRDNLAQEGITSGTSGNAASWADFWAHNGARLNAYLSNEVDAKIKEAIKNDVLVDKSTFISMVQDQLVRLEGRMADMESAWGRKLDTKFRDLVAALPKGQLNSMTNSLLLENAWSALHSVNFFARSLGAVVDPYLTSPTMAHRGFVRRALEKLTWIPGDLPPVAALMGWEEPTDCWCAARSLGAGRAQIGVIMPHAISPEKLVVEHIPRDGTLDIGSAPRGMEVWVEVEDEGVRAAAPAVEGGPGEKFVRVGSFEYRVDALNHIQAFDLNSELLTPVRKVVVRVTGTWGRDWTCLYRLRMIGKPIDDLSGFVE